MQIKFTNRNTKQRIRIENNESENSTDEKRQLQIGKDKANVKTDQWLKKAQQGIRKHNNESEKKYSESENTTTNQQKETEQRIRKHNNKSKQKQQLIK